METKFTKGEWVINHWEKGESGVIYLKKEGNISYFSGDAINHPHFNIVSRISFKEHKIQGSFEGAHIAEIYDISAESKVNAKLIAAAPEMFEALKSIYDDPETFNDLFVSQQDKIKSALKKATE